MNDKQCRHCGANLVRFDGESLKAFHSRQYCSRECRNLRRAILRKSGVWKPDLQPHVAVWLNHYGSLPPKGMHIHHLDGDPTNNAIENLFLCTPREHRRIHEGWQIGSNSEWLKPCSACGRMLPLDQFYRRHKRVDAYVHHCIECRRETRKKVSA